MTHVEIFFISQNIQSTGYDVKFKNMYYLVDCKG